MLGSLEQYLSQYAEPEARLDLDLGATFERALVVPACREAPGFLQGYQRAAANAGRTLCILVVNGNLAAGPAAHDANAALFASLLAELRGARRVAEEPPLWLGAVGAIDVLLVDRQSPGRRLPSKQGVGLARRIGCDIALALYRAGKLSAPWLYCTDADVELPRDYFDRLDSLSAPNRGGAVAALFPFTHVASGEPGPDAATALYEVQLRYHVLGLQAAGSPYAFHTIGSTIAVRADAYAAARGFPRRQAAEDFYLLAKLAKLGCVRQLSGAPLRIRSRFSDRVPFGTGRAVAEIASALERGEPRALYDPRSYAALAGVLRYLDALALGHDEATAARALDGGPLAREQMSLRLAELGLHDAARQLRRQAAAGPRLARALHTWFDAFRTLKWVHLLRDRDWPSVPWPEALARAEFLPTAARAGGFAADMLCVELARCEARSAPQELGLPGARAGAGAWPLASFWRQGLD